MPTSSYLIGCLNGNQLRPPRQMSSWSSVFMIRANTTRWCSLVGVMAQPGSTSEPIGTFCFSLHIGGRGTTSIRALQTRQSALALRRHELMRSICSLLTLSRNGLGAPHRSAFAGKADRPITVEVVWRDDRNTVSVKEAYCRFRLRI